MRRLLVFSIVYTLLGVLCGPVSGDPAPGRSPGPPGGLSMVHEGHSDGGGVSEDIPTLLLTKDRTEYGDDVREIIKNSSFDEILDISDNYVHKLKNNDNGHFIATTTQDPVKAPSENGSFFGSNCKLFLKHFSGTFDSTSMPTQHLDCAVFFPSVSEVALKAKATTQTHSGLLVHVTRLNVPCSEGGFLKFTGHRRLCGKLEELQHSERSYYFTNLSNTSVRIINRPSFAFEYKIVDYCYNVTLTQRNQTFFLQPAGLLECYFKIHLPYGYKINLMLTTNAHNTSEYTKREFINLSTRKKYFNTNDSTNTLCNDGVDSNGLQVQVYDRVADRRWTYCYNEFSQSRKITLISSDNSIVVAVRKYSAEFVRGTPPSPLIDDSEIAHYPSLQVEYSAQNIESVVSQCAFGWIAYQQFCISVIEGKPLSWAAAESECNHLGGHLVSIKSEQEQKIIDKLIINSPSYSDHLAYWIGASDKNFEDWFPGWSKYKEYNRQPNDDGLSSQDCVEIRRLFRLPPGNQPNQAPLVNSFMWNDRDCEAENYFVCERPMVDDPVLDAQWRNDCNKSIQLTIEHPKINVWSPGFPHPYPDNVNCYTLIIAPSTHRIIIDFEELVLEDEPNCSYDKLEILEPNIDLLPPQTDGVINSAFFHKVITSFAKRSDVKFQQSDKSKIYSHKILFNKPNDEASIPHKLCGDWSSKLKLLRYVTKGSSLALHFSSDYSHHFNGYKAKVYTESVTSECGDDRQRAYNKSCYLFVSFPEVDWWTAQQVCRSIGAQIASVANVDEQRYKRVVEA
uniref:Putative c-type lectin n=1 Tax=Lutzomyia longipalpis TaxID=7200 RepID=A0A1B0ETW2_LUTLO